MQNIVLVGNPNTGKTTLYNGLTKSNEHVGNWHGVTVDKVQKEIEYGGKQYNIVDLPGTYSLTPFSMEEKCTAEYIKNNIQDIYLCVCDSRNISKNLYLYLQLLEVDRNAILVLNEFEENKNAEKIKNKIKNKLNIEILSKKFKKNKKNEDIFAKIDNFCKNNIHLDYLKNFPIKEINNIFKKISIDYKFFTMRFLEGSKEYLNLDISQDDMNYLDKLQKYDYPQKIAQCRYKFIDEIFGQENAITYSKLDNFFLNKYSAIPIFFAIMFLIFYLTFSGVGEFISRVFERLIFDVVGQSILDYVCANCSILWVQSLFGDAIIGGVGSVLIFLPQVVLLFLFLNILEESGYLSRVAYIFEGIFAKFGLSGKGIFTWLMGFGCTATALLTAKNLNNKNQKIKTILTTAYLPCSAKLPTFAVICGAFFGGGVGIIFLLYLIAILVALFMAYIFNKNIPPQNENFILEFSQYQNPINLHLFKLVGLNSLNFIKRVGGYILAYSVIIWLLQSFDWSLHYVGDSLGDGILKSIAQFICPIFAPIGLDNWGIVCCLIAGLAAKELIISTMGIINGVDSGLGGQIGATLLSTSAVIHLSTPSALSFLTFILLYVPCIATYSVMRVEIGKKYTLIGYGVMLVVAYISSYIVYNASSIFVALGSVAGIMVLLSIILIATILVLLLHFRHQKCCGCNGICSACRKIKK